MPTVKQQSNADAYRHDLRGYQTGFALAAILTIVPHAVHVRYFLHVDLSPDEREGLALIVFSSSLLVLMIAGMLWILFNMNARMMPM